MKAPLLFTSPMRVLKAVPHVLEKRRKSILIIASLGYLGLALFFVGQQAYYRLPASYFLNFYQVTVNNGQPVEPNRDIPLEVCRKKRGNIETAYRKFYDVPENPNLTTAAKKEQSRLIKTVELKGPLEETECAQLNITRQQYDHTPGQYFFRQDVNFKVGGVQKFVSYESPIYIVADISNPKDIREQIEFYINRIKELEARLREQGIDFEPTFEDRSVQATDPASNSSDTSTVSEPTTSEPPENSPPSPSAVQPPQPGPVERLLDGTSKTVQTVRGIIGL